MDDRKKLKRKSGRKPNDSPMDEDMTDEVYEESAEELLEQLDTVKREKRRSTVRWCLRTTVLIIIIIILILLLLQKCSSDTPVLNPDFPPQDTEQNAKPIPGDSGDKLDHEEGGGAVSIELSDELTVDLSDRKAALHFANPGRSTKNMVLYIIIQDNVIARSGLIPPGYQLETLELIQGAAKMLTTGVYSGKIAVYCYDTETNERAMVNPEFPVSVTVER